MATAQYSSWSYPARRCAASYPPAVVRVRAPAVVVVVAAAAVVAVAMGTRHSGVARRHKASGGKPARNLHTFAGANSYRDRRRRSAGLR